MIMVTALDLTKPTAPIGKALAAVKGSVVYVSKDSIYLVTSDYMVQLFTRPVVIGILALTGICFSQQPRTQS